MLGFRTHNAGVLRTHMVGSKEGGAKQVTRMQEHGGASRMLGTLGKKPVYSGTHSSSSLRGTHFRVP